MDFLNEVRNIPHKVLKQRQYAEAIEELGTRIALGQEKDKVVNKSDITQEQSTR